MENSNNQMQLQNNTSQKCEICDKEFKRKKGLHRHFQNIHKLSFSIISKKH